MSKYSARSRFVSHAENDGSVHPQYLPYPSVTTLSRKDVLARIEGKLVAALRVHAVFDPDQERRNRLLKPGSIYLGHVRERIYGPTIAGRPVQYDVDVPVYEEPAEPGEKPEYRALFPEGVDPETRVDERVVAEIERDLAQHSILDCRRRTLVPRKIIETIAEGLPKRQWQALEADAFEVMILEIDGVRLDEAKGEIRGALNVTASNPGLGTHFPLALIDLESQTRAEVVSALADLLVGLPRRGSLLAIVTDYGKEDRAIVADALEIAQADCPELAPRLVIDRFHILKLFADAFNDFRVDTWKALERDRFGKKRKRISKERQDRITDIKRAAKGLCRMQRSTLEKKPKSKGYVEKAFKAAPVLEAGYWLLEDLRRIFDCRNLAAAEARYAAWKQKLAESGLTCFGSNANNLEEEWGTVRNYFEVLEILDARHPKRRLKIGTNHCENFNKYAKAAWRPGRRASIALIWQRLVARCGYRVQVRGRRPPEVSDAAD